jgi:hypothetical protein
MLCGMTTPRRTRIVLVPGGRDEPLRRYRLARLDEVALASPPVEPNGNGHRAAPPSQTGDGVVRDRRVPR